MAIRCATHENPGDAASPLIGQHAQAQGAGMVRLNVSLHGGATLGRGTRRAKRALKNSKDSTEPRCRTI